MGRGLDTTQEQAGEACHVLDVLQHIQHQHLQPLRARPQRGHVWSMRIRALVPRQIELLQTPADDVKES